MAHFYITPELEAAAIGDRVVVEGAEARHAVTVSRVRVGDPLLVGNGAGLVVSGAVVSAASDRLELDASEVHRTPPPSPAIWLAQALAKGGRDESAVQTCTELGVDGVIPWASTRSIVKWDAARTKKGVERWGSIAREASKQSMRAWIPEVAPPISSAQLARLAETSRLLVLDPGADAAIADVRAEADLRDIVLVVGPEGGITPEELALFDSAGATAVRLGSGILRTSSAGPAALAVLSVALGRW